MIQHPNSRNQHSGGDGIDLTSMIDVLFTLLIFFILTMGTTQITTQISLPKAEHYQIQHTDGVKPLVIEIRHHDTHLKVDDQIFKSFDTFQKYFLLSYQHNRNRPILLGLERSLPVERLTEMLNFLSVHQFSNVQIVSEWKT